jgi:hypothetical protein
VKLGLLIVLLPHGLRDFWITLYLVQELVHQWDVRNCLADKISSSFGSNSVAPIAKIDFQCLYNNEVRYLDLTNFLELRHSKEAVKRFLVAVLRTLALQEKVKLFLVAVQRTYTFPRHMQLEI